MTTPVLRSDQVDARVGVPVHFKCEQHQRTGSFKARGATNALLSTDVSIVATHSSGNHGAALAYAAQTFARRAIIVVPEGANPKKVENIRRYGAELVRCGPTLAERQATLQQVVADTGAHVVPPYDDERVIAGQGTAMLELLEQAPDVTSVWVPVGGGGMAAGCICAAEEAVQVVGAEPELAGDARQGLALGQRQEQMPPRTIADGLRTSLGVRNFEVLQRYGLPIHLVTEAEIVDAQKFLMDALAMPVEPSSAVPFAALLNTSPDRPVAVILTGGNLSPEGEE